MKKNIVHMIYLIITVDLHATFSLMYANWFHPSEIRYSLDWLEHKRRIFK